MATYFQKDGIFIDMREPDELQLKKTFEAIETQPQNKGNWLLVLYHIYCRLGEYDKAVECGKRVIDECTDAEYLSDAYYMLAHHYSDDKDYNVAIPYMEKAVEYVKDLDWIIRLGNMYRNAGQIEKAEKTYEMLLTTADDDGIVWKEEYYKVWLNFMPLKKIMITAYLIMKNCLNITRTVIPKWQKLILIWLKFIKLLIKTK